MSISSEQSAEAAIFLTLYQDALDTIKQATLKQRENTQVEQFTDRILNIYNSKIFRRISNPYDGELNYQNSRKQMQLVKEVRAFQFSQYVFVKYLSGVMEMQGNGQKIIEQIRQRTSILQNDTNQ